MSMKVWIVGQVKENPTPSGNIPWEFQGVFDSEAGAVAACRNPWYFVAPYTLNVALPDETSEMQGSYYPLPLEAPNEQA